MLPRRRAHTYPGEWADLAQWIRTGSAPDDEPVSTWERAVARFVGMPYAAAVSSGRRGMTLIFEHLGLSAGDEVIVPAYTLGALIPLIEQFGARAIPADVDLETFNVTASSVECRLTPRTKIILVLHTFGAPCPVEQIIALAAPRGIPVVEDCAHALGASIRGQPAGSFGYAGFFSFEPTKPVNTFGGGMVVSRDLALMDHIKSATASDVDDLQPLAKKIRAARMEQRLFATGLAWPLLYMLASPRWQGLMTRFYRSAQPTFPGTVRYSPIQAALGLKELHTLLERIQIRKQRVALLRSLLKPEIRLQRVEDMCESTWYFCVAVLPCPAAPVRLRMLYRGIDAGVEAEIADDVAASQGVTDCPNASSLCRLALALPMYDGISESAIDRVAGVLNATVS